MFDVTVGMGSRKFLSDLTNLDDKFRRGVTRGWDRSGRVLVNSAKKEIKDGLKTGRIYHIRGRRHRASAPGETPANLSGNLRRSIGYEARGWNQMEFGADAEYAGFLEEGTRKMKKRPTLGNTFRKEQGRIQRILYVDIEREFK